MTDFETLLAGFAEQPDASAMLRIRDAAESLIRTEGPEVRHRLPPGRLTFRDGWFHAALLERTGGPDAAREILEKLPEPAWGDPRALWLLTRARLMIGEGRGQPRWLLHHATRAAASNRLLRQIDTVWRQWVKQGGGDGLRPLRVAFLGTITTDFLFPALRPYLFADGFLPEIWNAPFGQYQQVIRGDDPGLRAFRPDLMILATDWRIAAQAGSAAAHVDELASLWSLCRDRYGAAVVQWNYEVPSLDPMGRLANLLPAARNRTLRAINEALWDAERTGRGASILDIDGIASEFGKASWEDPSAWEISRQYPSAAATSLLAGHLAALIRALRGLASKCLVLDLDNTLWGGVIGDDGLDGIKLGGTGSGAAYRLFQEYVRDLNRRGVLLAVCSKNDAETALSPFRGHPEMVLKESDIAVFRANWEPKEDSLRAIAATINIGTDSLVFVDDNPAERARVRQVMPEVETIELPDVPDGYRRALQESLRFEVMSITEEDLLRSQSVRANVEREELAASAATPEAWLHGLGMKVVIEPFATVNLPRIVQLINKTNQFNLTGVRVTDAEVREWMATKAFYGQTIRLSDRFGDFGLTAILFGFVEGDVLRIRNWVMSCRILGRGIEECMMAFAMREGRAAGVSSIEAEYVPTANNGMAAGLYPRLGFELMESGESGGRRYRLRLDGAAAASGAIPAWLSVN